MRSNIVHSELDHQRNKHSKSEKNQSKVSIPTTTATSNQLRLLPARAKTTASNHDENNKAKSNLAESSQAVKILPAARRYSVIGENNCINKMQSGAQVVSQSDATRFEKQSERLQANDICFINDELNEKQTALDTTTTTTTPTTSSFYFDEDLLDELLKTNIKESDNNKYPTSINDKIDYSILKLENSFKSDSLLNLNKVYDHNGLDLAGELDYDSINQIMNEFFSKSLDLSTNECELDYINAETNNNSNCTSLLLNQKNDLVDFDLNTDVLVQKFDPMIGNNSLFDIKLI